MQQTQERHDAEALGRWKTEECLTLCLLPQAWWADWWALATKSSRGVFKNCTGPAPEPITACEWLNCYATVTQKFATPWDLAASMGLPEIVVKLALQCRCSGVLCFCSSAAALVCCVYGVLCLTFLVCCVSGGLCISGVCNNCHRNVTRFRVHVKTYNFYLAKVAGTGAAYLAAREFIG